MILFLFGLTLLLAILVMLILVYLQLVWMRKRNKVVVPALTVVVDQASYLHGDTVQIGGALLENDVAVPDQPIGLNLPDGTTQSVVTDTNGKYSASWIVPDTVSGVLTITATGLGVTATTTFTLKKAARNRNICPCREKDKMEVKDLGKEFHFLSENLRSRISRAVDSRELDLDAKVNLLLKVVDELFCGEEKAKQ